MNSRQKTVVINFITVAIVTAVFVAAMMMVKDLVNKSEAQRAMKYIGQRVLDYRRERGSLPPETYLAPIKDQVVRLGEFHYRAQWIGYESDPDSVLAYAEKNFRSLFVSGGYVVLWLDGRVQWMEKAKFEQLLRQQQSRREIEMLQDHMKQEF